MTREAHPNPFAFATYILLSTSRWQFYIGQTNQPAERIWRHNTNRVKATRNKGPWLLFKIEIFLKNTAYALNSF